MYMYRTCAHNVLYINGNKRESEGHEIIYMKCKKNIKLKFTKGTIYWQKWYLTKKEF
jgi:hypothetical protein